jgi:transglutaminase-like putative cysteine protease
VDARPLESQAREADESIEGGVLNLLWEQQVRVDGTGLTRFHREVKKLLTPNAVATESELRFDFDPTYQRLTLHSARILRGGEAREALVPGDVRLIQQEADLDRKILDGTLSAFVFLRDVRVGDVVDLSWSVEGANPVLEGRFVDEVPLQYAEPYARIRYRLLFPSDRKLFFKGHNTDLVATTLSSPPETEYVLERRDVPGLTPEDQLPEWFDPYAWMQVSEFETWEDVAQWAARLMAGGSEEDTAALDGLARELRSKGKDDAGRALLALRFVQDEIRYLGLEIGPGTHRPHTPTEVLSQRFGDCKDKSLLLVTLLSKMGIDAAPVLVSTRVRKTLDGFHPTPFAFDHQIVRLSLGGIQFFVDPTESHQGGTLATSAVPPFERALVVNLLPGAVGPLPASALTPIEGRAPSPSDPPGTLVEVFAPGRRRVRSSSPPYRGLEADELRGRLADSSARELSRQSLNFAANLYPGARANGAKVTDDRLTTSLAVEGATPCRTSSGGTRGSRSRRSRTRPPRDAVRASPLRVEHPLTVVQKVSLTAPGQLLGEGDVASKAGSRGSPAPLPGTHTVSGPAFEVVQTVAVERGRLVVETRYTSRKDSVLPDEIERHLLALSEASALLAPGFRLRTAPPEGFTATEKALLAGGLAMGLLALTGFIVLRRRLLITPEKVTELPPELLEASLPLVRAPAVCASCARRGSRLGALSVPSPAELLAMLSRKRCSCGAALPEDGAHDVVRFDGKRLTLVTRRCAACGRESTFFEVGAGGTA